ncbi:MAG: hypothetical protein PHH85_03555 [Candidatus Methanoperedens sp.]|nr:hypothetical protein [Candidatus Methanoperedens sp.]
MGEITLNASSTGVTTGVNTANVFTDVFKMKVQAGTNLRMRNGTPLRMKLHDSSDAELPNTTEVLIGIRVPGQKQLSELGKLSYQPFANISTANQYDKDTETRRRIPIPTKTRLLKVIEDREIVVQAKSSAVVDWTKSFLELDCEEIVL